LNDIAQQQPDDAVVTLIDDCMASCWPAALIGQGVMPQVVIAAAHDRVAGGIHVHVWGGSLVGDQSDMVADVLDSLAEAVRRKRFKSYRPGS
jgi:hypothetical protein